MHRSRSVCWLQGCLGGSGWCPRASSVAWPGPCVFYKQQESGTEGIDMKQHASIRVCAVY
jgi:hypothetical protein